MATSLWFSGVRLYLHTDSRHISFPAVSGKPSLSEQGGLAFNYSSTSQMDKDRGPIPAGNYLINTADIIDYRHTKGSYVKAALAPLLGVGSPAAYLDRLQNAWGKMPGATGKIIPIRSENGSTEYAYRRNRCWIHGSDFPGSIGCIDLTTFMDAFLAELPQGAGTTIPLRVVYGVSPEGTETREIDRMGRDISNIG